MELNHEFDVSAPPDQAWAILTDLERIAPCMPGAQLTEVDGDEYRGTVKVKVGPITAQYKGVAQFNELDSEAGRAVLGATGNDSKGSGKASATITATLTGSEGGTRVALHTDLKVAGKVAQFGRGAMADVSSKLIDQFVANLEQDVLSNPSTTPETTTETTTPETATPGTASAASDDAVPPRRTETPAGPRRIDSAEAEPIDLVATAGGAAGVRIAAAVTAAVAALLVVLLLRRRARRSSSQG